jgi:hypothetical protein
LIISPTDINKSLLKRAWAIKCKKERKTSPENKDRPIKPKCLSVERATNFFKSDSAREPRPAYKEV